MNKSTIAFLVVLVTCAAAVGRTPQPEPENNGDAANHF